MNVDVLAANIVRADSQGCFLAFELKVLRLDADHAERKEAIIRTNFGRAFDNDVRVQNASIADDNPTVDPAKRPNNDVGADLRIGTDYGCRMDHQLWLLADRRQ